MKFLHISRHKGGVKGTVLCLGGQSLLAVTMLPYSGGVRQLAVWQKALEDA